MAGPDAPDSTIGARPLGAGFVADTLVLVERTPSGQAWASRVGPIIHASDGTIRVSRMADGPVDLPIVARTVSAVRHSVVSPSMVLELPALLEGGTDYVLQIDGPFRLDTPEASRWVDAESGADPGVLDLLARAVRSAIASSDGSLELMFEVGWTLLVPADVYESWQLYGSNDDAFVSAAGGGLAIFHDH